MKFTDCFHRQFCFAKYKQPVKRQLNEKVIA